jgi:hypothetical protein
MSEPTPKTVQEILADHAAVTAAITRAVRFAVLQHAQAGHAVPEVRDGKVVWVPPNEILARFANGFADDLPPAKNGKLSAS